MTRPALDPTPTRLDLRPIEARLPELEPTTLELPRYSPRRAVALSESGWPNLDRTDRTFKAVYHVVTWSLVVAVLAVLGLAFAAFVLYLLLGVAAVLSPFIPVPVTLLAVLAVIGVVVYVAGRA